MIRAFLAPFSSTNLVKVRPWIALVTMAVLGPLVWALFNTGVWAGRPTVSGPVALVVGAYLFATLPAVLAGLVYLCMISRYERFVARPNAWTPNMGERAVAGLLLGALSTYTVAVGAIGIWQWLRHGEVLGLLLDVPFRAGWAISSLAPGAVCGFLSVVYSTAMPQPLAQEFEAGLRDDLSV